MLSDVWVFQCFRKQCCCLRLLPPQTDCSWKSSLQCCCSLVDINWGWAETGQSSFINILENLPPWRGPAVNYSEYQLFTPKQMFPRRKSIIIWLFKWARPLHPGISVHFSPPPHNEAKTDFEKNATPLFIAAPQIRLLVNSIRSWVKKNK